MLRGNYPAKADEDGRVKIPSAWLESMRESENRVYVTSENGESARIYPLKFWHEIEEKLARISSYNTAKEKFLTRTNYYGQEIELDERGRIVVPRILRDAAQVEGEVDLLGNLNYVEVWNHARLVENLNNRPITEEGASILQDIERGREREPRIELVEFSAELLAQLKKSPFDMLDLDPDQFERLICDRLHAMGMAVHRVGPTHEPDGGIDIVAWPERHSTFPFLLAVQAKHHRIKDRKTGPSPVRELQAVLQRKDFQAGLLITNTWFTPSALWEAAYRPHLVRLRDFEDLKRWIFDDFLHASEWREIPDSIEYAPGRRFRIPKPFK